MEKQPQSRAWFPRLWPHQPHDLRVNQKPGVYRIISPIIIFSFVTVAKFKSQIKLRRHPSSIWAWENKNSCNESGFRPNSFSYMKETIDSKKSKKPVVFATWQRERWEFTQNADLPGWKTEEELKVKLGMNRVDISLFALYKHYLKPATCLLDPLHSSLSDTHSYTQLEHRNK